jgi:hypothetical protein
VAGAIRVTIASITTGNLFITNLLCSDRHRSRAAATLCYPTAQSNNRVRHRVPSVRLPARQAWPHRPLAPARPRVSADYPTGAADHTRTEGRHRDVIRPCIDGKHRLMVADQTAHRDRAHAAGPHFAERHGRAAVAIGWHTGSSLANLTLWVRRGLCRRLDGQNNLE